MSSDSASLFYCFRPVLVWGSSAAATTSSLITAVPLESDFISVSEVESIPEAMVQENTEYSFETDEPFFDTETVDLPSDLDETATDNEEIGKPDLADSQEPESALYDATDLEEEYIPEDEHEESDENLPEMIWSETG